MPSGRPSNYTPEIADFICARLAAGDSLNSICSADDMPHESTVRSWALDDREGFCTKYTRARELQALRWADEILTIADDSARDTIETENGQLADHEWINRSRLRVDSRKWLLSKVLPKVYGDFMPASSGSAANIQLVVVQAGAPGLEAGKALDITALVKK